MNNTMHYFIGPLLSYDEGRGSKDGLSEACSSSFHILSCITRGPDKNERKRSQFVHFCHWHRSANQRKGTLSLSLSLSLQVRIMFVQFFTSNRLKSENIYHYIFTNIWRRLFSWDKFTRKTCQRINNVSISCAGNDT